MRKWFFGGAVAALLSILGADHAFSHDTSGVHAFFNDDRSQFVDFWLNSNGFVTIKVSNGRPWRPMWVVLHANYMAGGKTIATKDYHVYCKSPNPGGGGEENWFKFPAPSLSSVENVSVYTNKEAPWKTVKEGWTPSISVSAPTP